MFRHLGYPVLLHLQHRFPAWALIASALCAIPEPISAQSLNPKGVSDSFARLYPSRAKTFIKASCDPDDRGFLPTRGNDDGFTGTNKCESYRTRMAGNDVSVLAHKAGRSGFMGCFFRNFWSDSTGLNIRHLEGNRTQMIVDGLVTHDMPLTDYFRSPAHPAGQVAPFRGPFTGGRAGGHVTHTPIAWADEFELRVFENAFSNAGRFHKVCGTLDDPDDPVVMPSLSAWEEVDRRRGSWPHATKRIPFKSAYTIAPGGFGELLLKGPATLLELTCRVGAVANWEHLTARFAWDGQANPSVDVPLRILGGRLKPPFSSAFKALLFHNDGLQRITCYLPMPFRKQARLQFVNTGTTPIVLHVTRALGRGAYPEPFGYFTAQQQAGTTQSGVPFQGPKLTDVRGMLRGIVLETGMDTTGRIKGLDTYHLEGDLLVRINGNRGDDHTFAASETSIGKWGWYLSPVDKPFAQDSSYHTGIIPLVVNGAIVTRRLMGSTFIFDPIHFATGIDIRLEHGVLNQSNADYELTTFFYLQPGAAREIVAEVDVGNLASESRFSVLYDQHWNYQVKGSFFRDENYNSMPVIEDVRHLRVFYSFHYDAKNEEPQHRAFGLGFRLDHAKVLNGEILQADVFVDGVRAGLLHVATSNALYRFKEGGECEVEIPIALTRGKGRFKIDIVPRKGMAPVKLARIWLYGYNK